MKNYQSAGSTLVFNRLHAFHVCGVCGSSSADQEAGKKREMRSSDFPIRLNHLWVVQRALTDELMGISISVINSVNSCRFSIPHKPQHVSARHDRAGRDNTPR